MTRKSFLAILPVALVAAGAALGAAPAAHAQFGGPPPGGGPGGPGGPGGFQMPPAMQKKMQAWRTWRDNHKNVAALQQTIAGLSEMDQDPTTRITGAEAKKILPVLKAWRTRPVMTDDQARSVNKQLTASLSIPQIKKIATTRGGGFGGGGRRGGGGGMGGPGGGGGGFGGPRPGGGGGGGFGGPGGGGPGGAGGGAPRRFDPSRFPDPKDYNPLNPDTIPFERARPRAKERIDGLITTLKSRA